MPFYKYLGIIFALSAIASACGGNSEGGEVEEPTETGAEAMPPVTPRGDGQVVEHTLRFPSPAQHEVEVETIFEAGGESITVMMPVWTPGSYLVREFARHVQDVRASALDGTVLNTEKVSKNRWEITANDGALPDQVVLRYRVYAREFSVRTNFVDADVAILVGAATYLVPTGQLQRQQDIRVERPETWAEAITALDEHPDVASGESRFLAHDFDELVDTPIVIGNPSVYRFEVEGVPHVLATFGGAGVWDDEKAARDVQAIVETQIQFWDSIPYRRYAFINLAYETGGGYGGLEHKTSTLVTANRWTTRDDEAYSGWLGLISHEFFHTWNVKRLRPEPLGPFDYEEENYVEDLWIAEGITSYYDNLLQARAGLLSEADYLARLTREIERLEATPGRHVQSLSASSYDSWIHFYRRDENTRNSGVSYYNKGSLVAFMLDARIRVLSGGDRSLDDAMRLAYARYSEEVGFTPEQIREVFSEVAGQDLSDFFARYVDGTEPLDFTEAFEVFGLQFSDPPQEATPYFGVSTSSSARIEVTEVVRGGPAHAAGINVGDELIALGDERLPADWSSRLALYEAGDMLSVLLSRRGLLRRVELRLGQSNAGRFVVNINSNASPSIKRVRTAWLGQSE